MSGQFQGVSQQPGLFVTSGAYLLEAQLFLVNQDDLDVALHWVFPDYAHATAKALGAVAVVAFSIHYAGGVYVISFAVLWGGNIAGAPYC